jgi:hypothetical protein
MYEKEDLQKKFLWAPMRSPNHLLPRSIEFHYHESWASNEIISELECIMVRIPLKTEFTPKRWRKCFDMMIQKKAGLLRVDSL